MYGKIFRSIYEGSMRGKNTLISVWVYLLVNVDAEGEVDVHPKVIADATGLPFGSVENALRELEGPDKESRSPDENGARIVRLDEHRTWGWRIVNYKAYRAIRDQSERREYFRDQKREARRNVHPCPPVSTTVNQSTPHAEAEAEEEEEAEAKKTEDRSAVRATRRTFTPPTLEELAEYCQGRHALGRPAVDPEAFLAHYESNGWRVGRNPMKSWKAAVWTWEKNGIRPNGSGGNRGGGVSAVDLMAFGNQLKREEELEREQG